jgi:hypothetical protein
MMTLEELVNNATGSKLQPIWQAPERPGLVRRKISDGAELRVLMTETCARIDAFQLQLSERSLVALLVEADRVLVSQGVLNLSAISGSNGARVGVNLTSVPRYWDGVADGLHTKLCLHFGIELGNGWSVAQFVKHD